VRAAGGGAASQRLARAFVALYPEAWRERYGEEMLALLEDDPPGVRGLASLLAGAAGAHLRPRAVWSRASVAAARVHLTVAALFGCWLALALAGAAFQKDTEDPVFAAAGAGHPLLDAARAAVVAGAILGALAVAAGGLPLLWKALLRARRDRPTALLLLLPPVALAAFAALTALALELARARGQGFPASFVLEVALPWSLAAGACTLVCALVPRAVLRRLDVPAGSLRRALRAGWALTAAMWLVAGGIVVYTAQIIASEPTLAHSATGPYGASTGLMLGLQALAALTLATLASVSALRARAALRSRPGSGR
jgi:hypothetical protein